MAEDFAITVTDAPDPGATAVITEGLGAYNDSQGGVRDFRPIAVLVADPATGATIGGLYGRTSYGCLFIDRFFLPEEYRREMGYGLFLELRGAPADGGGDALGGDDLAEALAELGLGRIERRDDVEADMDAVGETEKCHPNGCQLIPKTLGFVRLSVGAGADQCRVISAHPKPVGSGFGSKPPSLIALLNSPFIVRSDARRRGSQYDRFCW